MMRKTLLVALWVVLGMGFAHAAPPEQTVLDVGNLTCPACSITIEKALGHVAGVDRTRVKVDTRAGTVTVSFDPERTTVSAVARAITDAGYPATPRSSGR